MLEAIFLLIGFFIIIKSSDILVDCASSLAIRCKIPKMLIALTIVAFGTCAPEVAISFQSVANHNGTMAFANVIGSCIVNTFLIIGLAAIVRPIKVKHATIKKELPILLIITTGFVVLMVDSVFNPLTPNTFSRADGIILILLFCMFVSYIVQLLKRKDDDAENIEPVYKNIFLILFLLIGSIICITLSSDVIVNNAISHDSDTNGTRLNELQLNKSGQPEIIKVDDLLNIIWLSNPQINLSKDEIIDMGVTSLISYTINSSLPKSRIIKELDDNIQKYRKDYNLTDKDVVNLSTRIANRQIKDVDSLNQLAKNDAQAFAIRVKDESRKEELAKTISARKFEELFKTADNLIKELQSNKENLQKKHEERMEALDAKESALKSESARLKDKESEMKREKDSLSAQISEKDTLLRNLYDKYCRDMESEREAYLKSIVKKKKRNSIIWVIILGIIILFAFFLQFFDNSLYSHFIAFVGGSKGWGWILSIALLIIEYFVINKAAKFYDPVYVEDYKETIKIPDKLIKKSYEVYIREAQQIN